jgi:hypothetical protein
VSGGGGGNLAATLALDNKTNSIPITSNDGNAQLILEDTGNVELSSYDSDKKIYLATDSFNFSSDVRYLFQGKGVDINTTTDGFGLPRLTTTQMNAIVAPTEGMLVRNTTESSIYQYNGTAWEPLGSAAPTLPEFQIAVGQVGDAFGSSADLTFEGGDLKVLGNNVMTVADGQPLDSDLTDISSLAPPNDNILQRKAGAWTSRTPAQLKTDLALGNVENTSDADKPVSTAQATAINAKVTDAIVNGVTTVAPSQNAVFDALALKQNNFVLGKKGNASSTLTGTTTETILESIFIPAGSVAVDDVIYMRNRITKLNTSINGFSVRYRINTSNSISGSSVLGIATLPSGSNWRSQGIERTLNFRASNTIEVMDNTTSFAYENATTILANTNITLTYTSGFWILITAQLTNGADSIVNSNYIIQKF